MEKGSFAIPDSEADIVLLFPLETIVAYAELDRLATFDTFDFRLEAIICSCGVAHQQIIPPVRDGLYNYGDVTFHPPLSVVPSSTGFPFICTSSKV